MGYYGGASEAEYALELCRGLRKSGWSVTTYTRDIPSLDKHFRDNAIDLRHIPMQGLTDYGTIRRLAGHLNQESRDTIILVQTFRTAFIALCARKLSGRNDLKVVMVSHKITPTRNTFLSRRVYRNLSALIFSSEHARDEYLNAWPQGKVPTPSERIHIIYNSLDRANAPVAEPKTGPIVALYDGLITEDNELESLIDILPSLRGHRLRLMLGGRGRTEYIDRLRRRALSIGVMDLISWQTGAAVDTLIERSHFGVFPYGDSNAFGYANIRLMAAGKPQIITDTRIAREYLSANGGATYIRPNDPNALQQSMLTLAAKADLRQQQGQEARHRFDTFLAWPDFLQRFIDIVASQ